MSGGLAFGLWPFGSALGALMMADTTRMIVLGSLGRAQPVVKLVSDMLGVEAGWTFNYHHYQHQTGVEVEQRYDGFIRDLKINGSPVTLRAPDKLRLYRAVKRLERHRKAVADDQAAKLLAERMRTFATRAEQFADTVVPFRHSHVEREG